MDLETLLSYPWGIMMPEFIILGVATFLSLLDLFLKDKVDRKIIAWLGLAGIGVALLFVIKNINEPIQHILYETFRLDGFAIGFKLIFLVGAALVFLLSLDYIKKKDTPHEAEYYYLILTAVLGAMILASSADMITMFIGLELLSLSTYILVGMRKKRLQSNESAFKYVVNGGIATAITLYGLSFVYGLTGTTNLYVVAERLPIALQQGYDLVIFFAFFLTFVGLAFKIAVIPFHMWTPDVYQGAPTPITAFLSVVSKAAGFAFILRFFLISFNIYDPASGQIMVFSQTTVFIGIIAAITIIVGNVIALRQTNVKRMFAYSSVAQAGYILVPFAVFSPYMLDMMLFYLVAYLFMNIGAFAIIQAVSQDTGTEELSGFAGLYHRSPFQAVTMSIFLISLAGLPVTAGFFGKFYIFLGSLDAGNWWLATVMVLGSVISYYYYFGVIRQMYLRAGSETSLNTTYGIGTVIVLCTFGTLLLGVFPSYALDFFASNFNIYDIFR
ncbi:NADH-quinone oxidoreductase subunit NuoN [Caldalkalibacillus salinus]|uniref:NADH-quinone oxidoreductase subunit NuoN n=1 Tax=Caldalkalibacillus salinus TaxID=2803787 RepID=UPI0019246465|nr:NADH-quinone oxidoreductase subunit NuoN [Caldalkalibacillus salinus]